MAINYTKNTNKNSTDNLKKDFIELEIKIFEKILLDFRFKGIPYPFAVLEKNENVVVLGSNKEVVGKVSYNYSLESVLREIVGSIVGDDYIKIELKVAENEFLSVKKRIEKNQAKQKEEEQALAEINAQKAEGKCNLIPFPIKENKVRSDLSVERHAIFAANTFKGDFRIYERSLKDPQTGADFILRIKIGNQHIKGLGVLKQKHQEVFYKLSQLWALQNYQIEEDEKNFFGSLELSIYELVQAIRKDDAGHHYQSVMRLLNEMGAIRINIRKIYTDGTTDIQDFSLLSYGWSAKQFDEKTLTAKAGGYSKVRIRFSDFVTDEFLRKNVKSLMLAPYLSLKDQGRKGVAQLLYTMLDYELSTKEKFNISLVKLSERLGLAQYNFKSKRKEKLESSINIVNGAKILDGKYKINAYLLESEDKKDWIFIARKIALPEITTND